MRNFKYMTQHIKPGKPIIYLSLLVAVIFNSSCVKNWRDGETDFSGTQPVGLIAEGGLSGNAFSAAALVYPPSDVADTVYFHVNYAATNVAPANEQFTLAVDPGAVTTYNSTSDVKYSVLPDSVYTFTTTQVTVNKGDNYVAVPFILHPDKIPDPTVSYMIPITLKSVPAGTTLSGNQATIYYHVIGNPIAGTYEEYWSRWNGQSDSSGGAATAAYYKADLGAVAFAPNSPTQISATDANGTGETDIIDFTNNNGVLSDFSVSFPAGEAATLQLTSIGTPVLDAADPATGYYRISFPYVNGSGLPRFIIVEYIKQ